MNQKQRTMVYLVEILTKGNNMRGFIFFHFGLAGLVPGKAQHMLFSIITFVSLSACLFLSSCCEPTKPTDNGEPDTTSHAFTWQIYEFPTKQFYSNYLWDIFAVSDTNVWAVGQIYTDEKDSLGNYVERYNAIKWDGNEWTFKRFWLKYDHNPPDVNPINAIWYFNENSIYLCRGSIYHYKGNIAHRSYDAWTYGSVYHLWAASENNIFGVGSNGLIVHYDGKTWNQMESGTTMDFQDIWGSVDEETGEIEVWTVGFNEQEYFGIVLKYDGTQWETLFSENSPLYGNGNDHKRPIAIFGLKDSLYIALDGFITTKIVRHSRKDFTQYSYVNEEDQGAILAINGTNQNDYFAVGTRDLVLHYNGNSMKKYFDWIYLDGRYHGVQQVGDEVFICGYVFGLNTALILHGKR